MSVWVEVFCFVYRWSPSKHITVPSHEHFHLETSLMTLSRSGTRILTLVQCTLRILGYGMRQPFHLQTQNSHPAQGEIPWNLRWEVGIEPDDLSVCSFPSLLKSFDIHLPHVWDICSYPPTPSKWSTLFTSLLFQTLIKGCQFWALIQL